MRGERRLRPREAVEQGVFQGSLGEPSRDGGDHLHAGGLLDGGCALFDRGFRVGVEKDVRHEPGFPQSCCSRASRPQPDL